MAEIAGLLVRLEATTALLRAEMKKAEGAVAQTETRINRSASKIDDALSSVGTSLKASLAGVAAGVTAEALGGAVTQSLAYATNLKQVAAQSGLTTRALQQLNGAFTQLGLGADGFENALEEMLPNLGEALAGSGGAAEAFTQLGVSLKDAQGNVRSTDAILLDMADALAKVPSAAERAGIASKVFGEEAGPKMAQSLSVGSAAIRRLMNDTNVMSDDLINRAAEIDKKWQFTMRQMETGFKSALLNIIAFADEQEKPLSAWVDRLAARIRNIGSGADERDLGGLEVLLADVDTQIATRSRVMDEQRRMGNDTKVVEAQINALLAERERIVGRIAERTGYDAALKADPLGQGLGGLAEQERQSAAAAGAQRGFLVTGADGKPATSTNALRFGAASEESYEDIERERDAAAKRSAAAAESAAKQQSDAIRRVIADLQTEADTIGMTADQQRLYNALKQAGVTADSDTGKQIAAEVALIKQRSDFMDFWLGQQEADAAGRAEGAAVLASVLTPAELYNNELERLVRLLNAGDISQRTYNAAVAKAAEDFDTAQKQARKLSPELEYLERVGDQAFDRIGSAATEMALAGGDAFKSLRNVGQAVLSELMQSMIQLAAINPIKNALFGQSNPILSAVIQAGLSTASAGFTHGFGNIGGAGGTYGGTENGPQYRATGGPVLAGQPYVVGENRPELFVPDTNGRILPRVPTLAGAAGSRQSAGDTMQLSQSLNFSLGVASTVRAEVMNLLPTIAAQSRAFMLDSQARRGRSL